MPRADPFGPTSLQPTTTAHAGSIDLELLARESSSRRGGRGWLWVSLFALAAVAGGAGISAARGGHPIAELQSLVDRARAATHMGGSLDLAKLGDKPSGLAGGDNPVAQATAAQGATTTAALDNGSAGSGSAANTATEHAGPSGIDPESLPLVGAAGAGSPSGGGGSTVAARVSSGGRSSGASPAVVAAAPARAEPARASAPSSRSEERIAKSTPVAEPPPAPPPPPKAPEPPPAPKTGLQAAIEQAVVGKNGGARPAAPADAPAPVASPPPQRDMGDVPDAPGTGAVTSALAARMGAARACVEGQDAPSHANVTFGPSGSVINVSVSGPAAGTPAEKCIRDALWRATVGPFRRSSYSAKVNIRP